jgi:hypothetical protein
LFLCVKSGRNIRKVILSTSKTMPPISHCFRHAIVFHQLCLDSYYINSVIQRYLRPTLEVQTEKNVKYPLFCTINTVMAHLKYWRNKNIASKIPCLYLGHGPSYRKEKECWGINQKQVAQDWFQLIMSLICFVTMYLANMDETIQWK